MTKVLVMDRNMSSSTRLFTTSERSGEDAGAPLPDQQMRAGPRYPVDRYLVESSKIEMVNIIDDDIWNSEPALRPEEEIILRKLHEMLQSTADDLKLLSGELAAQRAPVPVPAAPTPLDEEFNEKVHIEEIVNAKFHGYKIINKTPKLKQSEVINMSEKNLFNSGIQLNTPPLDKKPTTKQLTKSHTRIVQINAVSTKDEKVDITKKPNKETVIYNEFTYQYPTANNESFVKGLQVQVMPSINIRSELREQKVLLLDIEPEPVNIESNTESKNNVGVISVHHEVPTSKTTATKFPQTFVASHPPAITLGKKPARKVTKMMTCESSTSTNNVSSDPQHSIETPAFKNKKDQNKIYKRTSTKTEPPKQTCLNLDEWKKKLNSVYGQSSKSKTIKIPPKSKAMGKIIISPKKTNVPPSQSHVSKPEQKLLNNAQYIPYSQLTLGGVNVSDIEKEISNIPNKSNIPLSPILDRIISSQENSCNNTPRKKDHRDSSKILTTSDENLLREVIDIEKAVNKTLSKNTEIRIKDNPSQRASSGSGNDDTNESDSYVDDFEDEKSAKSDKHSHACQLNSDMKSTDKSSNSATTDNNTEEEKLETPKQEKSIHNTTYSKVPNLSLKNRVDVFEYVHEIDTQDTATQSQTTSKISLKETQTSPRNESPSIPLQPIHNDLWPSMDPSKQIEKMFKLEKDLIKKLIMNEYGDLLQNSIDKPNSSKDDQGSVGASLNIKASQKVTQTSPKHAKSVMTSPTRTKTRTTSPFHLSLPVDHQTSPLIVTTTDKDIEVNMEQEPEDLGITINLSSPRFSLRLPNTSVEVLSNLEICSRSPSNVGRKQESGVKLSKTVSKNITSSTSIDADNSSSEISSLGEIRLKLKKRLRKNRISSSPETSSTSSSILNVDLNSVSILPLRSEGELSSIHRPKSRNTNVPSKSEGEISFGKR